MKRSESDHWFERAGKVIPGGIYGHMAPGAGLPREFPHYCSHATGCEFTDVDGNEWIDFMCGFGAVLHGYRHPFVEAAVDRQRSYGSVFNQPSHLIVELAERLVSNVSFADWAVFAKNGSDLTTWAVRVAREKTGREFVIKARGAYHGVDAWCDPGMGGRISSDRMHVMEFSWNDLDELESLVRTNLDNVAALILTPYHHASYAPSELPVEGFWQGVRSLCDKHGIALILDDVRCGGRLHDSGSHEYFGFIPDLAIYSKALGNGYAISACVGAEAFRNFANEVFLTGSCWNDSLAISAAIASLELSRRDAVAQSVTEKGMFFCSRLEDLARKAGIALKMTGPPSMPYPWIEEDHDLYQVQSLCKRAARNGLYFHPYHNWFISNAMTQDMMELALTKASKAFDEHGNA